MKWQRSLGTSKKEQGIITPKAPKEKSCGCTFVGSLLITRGSSEGVKCKLAHAWTETMKSSASYAM